MRRVVLDAPFTEGIVTDVPVHRLGPRHSASAQDGYSPSGVFTQRKGWEYDGSTADVAANLTAVYRSQFILADETRSLTVTSSGAHYVHNPSSSGSIFVNRSGTWLPRCLYQDELLFCSQDGLQSLHRWSGAVTGSASGLSPSGTATSTVGEATIRVTAGGYSAAPPSGSYVRFVGGIIPMGDVRVLNGTQTLVTLEGIRTGTATAAISKVNWAWGYAYPAVSVYNAGTISVSGLVLTGYGTKFLSNISSDGSDAVLIMPPTGDAEHGVLYGATTDTTTLTQLDDQATKSAWALTRALPFKDAQAHKGSLWGTGVAQYPSRVYVGPPGWNLAFPPGFTEPFDPTVNSLTSANPNDFLMDFIDVPSSFDGDDNIAILSSPNPLLVLKRNAVYGVYGSYPNFSVDMVADGIGCIDIRSAWSYDEGQFWCGEAGIYWYSGGQITDLTAGRINREWRALTRDFDYGTSDYCTLGLSQGHLVVHITTGSGTVQRTYLCDLRDRSWQSRISNFTPRFLHTSRIPGEKEKLLAVSNARQGRVLNFTPAIDGSGTAKDDAGTGPRLSFQTSSGLGQSTGIEGMTNFVDLDVHANVVDPGAAGSTVLSLSTVHGGGLENQADVTNTLTAINSDATDRIDRASRRIGRKARLHQVRGEVTTLGTDSASTKVEVHEIVATMRDGRGRS